MISYFDVFSTRILVNIVSGVQFMPNVLVFCLFFVILLLYLGCSVVFRVPRRPIERKNLQRRGSKFEEEFKLR